MVNKTTKYKVVGRGKLEGEVVKPFIELSRSILVRILTREEMSFEPIKEERLEPTSDLELALEERFE